MTEGENVVDSLFLSLSSEGKCGGIKYCPPPESHFSSRLSWIQYENSTGSTRKHVSQKIFSGEFCWSATCTLITLSWPAEEGGQGRIKIFCSNATLNSHFNNINTLYLTLINTWKHLSTFIPHYQHLSNIYQHLSDTLIGNPGLLIFCTTRNFVQNPIKF